MATSWSLWALSAIVFIGAIRVVKAMPGARDFRRVTGVLAILALAAAAARADLRWHLVWFTPVALAAAYVYALRRLFALSHRVNKIVKSGMTDPDEIRRSLQGEVDKYNRDVPDDSKMR